MSGSEPQPEVFTKTKVGISELSALSLNSIATVCTMYLTSKSNFPLREYDRRMLQENLTPAQTSSQELQNPAFVNAGIVTCSYSLERIPQNLGDQHL